jgi:hypothetical protein
LSLKFVGSTHIIPLSPLSEQPVNTSGSHPDKFLTQFLP